MEESVPVRPHVRRIKCLDPMRRALKADKSEEVTDAKDPGEDVPAEDSKDA